MNVEDGRWGRVVDHEIRAERRSTEESIVLSICALGLAGVVPFLAFRLMRADWLMAFVDAVFVVAVAATAAYVWCTGRTYYPSMTLTACYMGVMVTVVHLQGAAVVYWAYPTMVSSYFLVPARVALTLNILAGAALLPALLPDLDSFHITGVAVTLAIVSLCAYIFAARTAHQREQLMTLATKDPLTKTGNRRALSEQLETLIRQRDSGGPTASLVLLDLDHFKAVNDRYGHDVGDDMLVRLSDVIRTRVRRADPLFRYGGEEFVLPANGADAREAAHLAEELRELVETTPLGPDGLSATISAGVAELTASDDAKSWLRRADRALYRAKHAGRNTTRVAGDG